MPADRLVQGHPAREDQGFPRLLSPQDRIDDVLREASAQPVADFLEGAAGLLGVYEVRPREDGAPRGDSRRRADTGKRVISKLLHPVQTEPPGLLVEKAARASRARRVRFCPPVAPVLVQTDEPETLPAHEEDRPDCREGAQAARNEGNLPVDGTGAAQKRRTAGGEGDRRGRWHVQAADHGGKGLPDPAAMRGVGGPGVPRTPARLHQGAGDGNRADVNSQNRRMGHRLSQYSKDPDRASP